MASAIDSGEGDCRAEWSEREMIEEIDELGRVED